MTDTTLAAAFIEAQREIVNPKKNSTNPAFKSKYADLEEMLRVIKPVLLDHGIAIVQPPVSDDNGVGVRTLLMGYGDTLDFGAYTVPLGKRDAQGAGSALTYTRRYALAAVFGLAQVDDDGNAASQPAKDTRWPRIVDKAKADPAIASALHDKIAEYRCGEVKTAAAFQALTVDARDELAALAGVA